MPVPLTPRLESRIAALGLRPGDFEEVFARASGPGGQNVNKVATAATIRHRSSGLAVTAQDARSQFRNRQIALERLLRLLESRAESARAQVRSAREKVRRQNSPRPRALQRRIRSTKERRSEVKRDRSTIREVE